MKSLDTQCGSTNNNTALSIFTAATSCTLMIFTIPLNSLIIYALVKEHKKRKEQTLFYMLLLNIIIADLLTGLIADPSAMTFLIREAQQLPVPMVVKYINHLSLFFTDAVALMALTFLSVERVIALVYPIKHFKGMTIAWKKLIVAITWPLAFLLVIPYFEFDFITQLMVFSTVNLVVTVVSLLITTAVYYRKLVVAKVRRYNSEMNTSQSKYYSTKGEIGTKKVEAVEAVETVEAVEIVEAPRKRDHVLANAIINNKRKHANTISKLASPQRIKMQEEATKTFLTMLIVFVVTYCPTAVTMVYASVCRDCDCRIVHIMRDVSAISILSSSLFRPLNFILTMKNLRLNISKIFKTGFL